MDSLQMIVLKQPSLNAQEFKYTYVTYEVVGQEYEDQITYFIKEEVICQEPSGF